MNKVKILNIIKVIIAIFSFVSCNHGNKIKKVRTVRFHYAGEIKRNINLKLVDSLYVEDSTVIQKRGGIIRNSEMSAKISYILLKSIYKESSDIKLPITVTMINEDTWHNRSCLPNGADGGAGEISLSRQNSEILFYCHYK